MADPIDKLLERDGDFVTVRRGTRSRRNRGTVEIAVGGAALVHGSEYGSVTPPATGAPAPVTNVVATPGAGGFALSWAASPGAETYYLKWARHDGTENDDHTLTAPPFFIHMTGEGYAQVVAIRAGLKSTPTRILFSVATTPVPEPNPEPGPSPLPNPGGGGAGLYYEKTWPASLVVGGDLGYIHGIVSVQSGTLIDGSTGRFIRSVWTSGGPRVGEETHGVDLSPPGAVTTRPREVWLEAEIRYNGSGWQRTADDKTLFVLEDWRNVPSGPGTSARAQETQGASEVWRWTAALRGSTGGSFWGGPYSRLVTFGPHSVFDGQWHRLRVHFKMASNETATDGIYQVWIDNELVANYTGIRTDSAPEAFFRVIALGRNADPGPGNSRDWGTVRVYTANPGW